MRTSATALLCVVLLVLTSCTSNDARLPPRSVRVAGPDALSYVVVTESWAVEPTGLRWSDGAGRHLASLSGAATFAAGYAAGACGEAFSARAVAGFAWGHRHPGVVRRFVRAVGGTPSTARPARWRVTLLGGTAARLTRMAVTVADPGPCVAATVDLAVLTPRRPGRDADAWSASWVMIADRGPGAAPEADLVAMATSLRSH